MSIHPTAIVDPAARIEDDVEIGPCCVIDANVRIASGCRLLHHVFVTGWTTIERECVLHPGVIVGHEPQDLKYDGSRSYCRVGERTILREYVTIHRGTEPESETVVGRECFLLAGAHVAHNCNVGDGVTLINNVLLAGHVTIGKGATLGGGAVVHQFVRIGEGVMVPGNARVPKDLVPFALADVEGRIAGLNRLGMRRSGMSREDLVALRDAYRIVFTAGLKPAEAADKLADHPNPHCRILATFLKETSRRGLAGRARSPRAVTG